MTTDDGGAADGGTADRGADDGAAGCDAAIGSDPLNCGACGNACQAPPNAHATCAAGQCGYACNAGSVEVAGECNAGGGFSGAWSFAESQFVFDQVVLPATSSQAAELGFDLDGNGTVDNQYGNIMAALGSFFGGATPQTTLDEAIARGEVVHLLALFAQSLASSPTANVWQFLGQPAQPPLIAGPRPGSVWAVDTSAGPPDAFCGGRMVNGGGTFGGLDGKSVLKIPFLSTPQVVNVHAARVEFDLAADGLSLMNGRIGGVITQDDIDALMVATANLLNAEVASMCTMAGSTCVCAAGSSAATIQEVFDLNGDCQVSLDEVRNNSIIKAFLKPDVVLSDGTTGLSLGVGFHAVNASFAHPAPP